MYTRQSITEFLNGFTKLKISSFRILFGRALKLGFRRMPTFLWALIKIIEMKRPK
jgi:hypothetical protein